MKYLVQDQRIIGTAEGLTSEPPQGMTTYESPLQNLIGYSFVDGKLVEPTPYVEPQSFVKEMPSMTFWGTDTFKKARIKANKDPFLALQLTLAMMAEQKGDRLTYEGAVKSVEDSLRKAAKVAK